MTQPFGESPWSDHWERTEVPQSIWFPCETCGAEVEAWRRRMVVDGVSHYLMATVCPNEHQDERPAVRAAVMGQSAMCLNVADFQMAGEMFAARPDGQAQQRRVQSILAGLPEGQITVSGYWVE